MDLDDEIQVVDVDETKTSGRNKQPATTAVRKSSTKAPSSSYELPWVEKHRPTDLSSVVGNRAIIDRLRVVAKNGNMPHLLLAGPPGTGKTTCILALARQTLGPQFRNAVLELNASDDRGIEVVRTKIKMFAQQKVSLPPGRQKIILLDEADSMTTAAQQALRRTMEIYSSTTRFALACNLSSKIIEPIQSRCAVVRFGRLDDKDIAERLEHVLEEEHVPYDQDGIKTAVFLAEGDMRNALNNCQSAFNGFGTVNESSLHKVADQPHPTVAKSFLEACVRKDIGSAIATLDSLVTLGYPPTDIVQTMFRVAKIDPSLEREAVRLQVLRHIGLVQMRMAEGNPSVLQLKGLAGRLCSIAVE